VSVAIIKDAQVRWCRGFGVKDAASRQRVDTETIFEAASMSKPVFAYFVMKLCEGHIVDLDTPLTKYSSKRFLQGDPRLDLITARHVLSHTSGFQNWRSDQQKLKIHFMPGEKWMYSGEGYNYLQTVVTAVLGIPFEVYMDTNILKPFLMSSSSYLPNGSVAKHMARGHDAEGKLREIRKSTPQDIARYGAAGALLTTPSDYAKFLIEVIHPKPSDTFRLNKTSLKEMLRPQIEVSKDKNYTISWGLGWRIVQSKDGIVITHGGENPGFQSWAEASVEKQSGFVLTTNGDNGIKLIRTVGSSLAEKLYAIS
ncbi:MAG TPA: serine hydrolase domain-containing protein, partial [Terriglobales bacterium]|nr:serine hydrolase domain-containing protein [Terriglobales bacterium]